MKELNSPSLGFLQIQGLKSMRKLLLVSTPYPHTPAYAFNRAESCTRILHDRPSNDRRRACRCQRKKLGRVSSPFERFLYWNWPNAASIIDRVNRKPSRCSGRAVECTCMYTRQRISSPNQELHHFFVFTVNDFALLSIVLRILPTSWQDWVNNQHES